MGLRMVSRCCSCFVPDVDGWAGLADMAVGLRYTGVWNSAMLQSNDVSTAMMAGLKKKTARFEKL